MEIRNVPSYAQQYPYWVFKEVEGEYWFYGAYDSIEKAVNVAVEVHGKVKVIND